jgi:excisionase family DNA binding protein
MSAVPASPSGVDPVTGTETATTGLIRSPGREFRTGLRAPVVTLRNPNLLGPTVAIATLGGFTGQPGHEVLHSTTARAALTLPARLTRKGDCMDPRERLLTPGEVAALFRVDPKTVTRWAAAGRIHSIRTPGGHRRFLESEVRALLQKLSDDNHVTRSGA